jgi:hypothetical protein
MNLARSFKAGEEVIMFMPVALATVESYVADATKMKEATFSPGLERPG